MTEQITQSLDEGIAAFEQNEVGRARQIFRDLVVLDDTHLAAWLWLAHTAVSEQERVSGLHRAYQLDPASPEIEAAFEQYGVAYPPTRVTVEETGPADFADKLVGLKAVENGRWWTRLLGEPHVPPIMRLLLVLVIVSDAIILLIGQRYQYWFDYRFGYSTIIGVSDLLMISPFLFFGVALIYSGLIGVAMSRLSYGVGVVAWALLLFLHVGDSLLWLGCPFQPIVPFEGVSCLDVEVIYLVAIAIVVGVALTISLRPADAVGMKKKKREVSRFFYLGALLWLSLLTSNLIFAINVPPKDADVVPHPELVRNHASSATAGATSWLFGGADILGRSLNDLWYLEDGVWVEQDSESGPPARIKAVMVYDEARDKLVLFGGLGRDSMTMNDVWEWDITAKAWTEGVPVTEAKPSTRCCHTAFYDPISERTIIYGGVNEEGEFFPDAWAWDGREWVEWEMSNNGFPIPAYSDYPFAYDSKEDRIIVMDGTTWEIKDGQWSQLLPARQPGARQGAGLLYYPKYDLFVLHSGYVDDEVVADTWVFKNNEWYQIQVDEHRALDRWAFEMFLSADGETIYLSGGIYPDKAIDGQAVVFPLNEAMLKQAGVPLQSAP